MDWDEIHKRLVAADLALKFNLRHIHDAAVAEVKEMTAPKPVKPAVVKRVVAEKEESNGS